MMGQATSEPIYQAFGYGLEPQTIGDLVRMSDQYRQSAILHYAVARKLFDQTVTWTSAARIADRLHLVDKKVRILLDALAALGLLKKKRLEYENTELANRYLTSESDECIGAIIEHQRLQWGSWNRLDEVLGSASSLEFQQESRFARDIPARDAFNGAMVRLSQPMVDTVKTLDVFRDARRVIDLAGGHGTYIAQIALQHPHIEGEIWDLPTTADAARSTITNNGLGGRVRFVEKSITDPASFEGCTADIVMLNDCLHYFDESQVGLIIGLASRLVAAKGSLLVLTMTLEENRLAPALSADFSLHMMVNTVNGELHPTEWIAGTMRGCGLHVGQIAIGRYTLLVGQQQ